MKHLFSFLVDLLAVRFRNQIFTYLDRSKKGEKGKVYLPIFFLLLGAIVAGGLLITTIVSVASDEPIWVCVGYALFSLLGFSLVTAFINCRITYDEDSFTTKNFWGMKRHFTYDQVTAIKEDVHGTYIYIGKKRVAVDGYAIGGIEFIQFVKQKYRSLHGRKQLPHASRSKFDVFNGNIREAETALVAYIILIVLSLGVFVFFIYDTYFAPPFTENNTPSQSVSFISYDIDSDQMILTSSDNQTYKILYLDKQFSTAEIQALCNQGSTVTVYSEKKEQNDGEILYFIKAIVYHDKYILSFEQTAEWEKRSSIIAIVVFGAFFLFWVFYVAAAIIVGRNPRKYSKRVVRFFFRDEYIKH